MHKFAPFEVQEEEFVLVVGVEFADEGLGPFLVGPEVRFLEFGAVGCEFFIEVFAEGFHPRFIVIFLMMQPNLRKSDVLIPPLHQ